MNKLTTKVLLSIIGWLIFLIAPFVFQTNETADVAVQNIYNEQSMMFLLSGLVLIGIFYFNYNFLFPQFFLQRKYVLYSLLIAISLTAVFVISYLSKILFDKLLPIDSTTNSIFIEGTIYRFLLVIVLSSCIYIFKRWKKSEDEILKAEISYLKAQINPHFLFNTLNSIYSLSVKKSEHTSDAIVKLSNMMRYVITEANHDFVSLENELKYINSYIELQKLRLTSNVKTETEIVGDPSGLRIAPLLLIPFIENAFKHGVNTEEPCYIKIFISTKRNELHFYTENKKVKSKRSPGYDSGLGVDNSKQRLQLLYPRLHVLELNDSSETFSVDLKIILK